MLVNRREADEGFNATHYSMVPVGFCADFDSAIWITAFRSSLEVPYRIGLAEVFFTEFHQIFFRVSHLGRPPTYLRNFSRSYVRVMVTLG